MSFLITEARIFDGENVSLPKGHVLVEGGLIKAVFESMPSSLPEGCITVSGVGCTLVPGLIDAHVHTFDEVQTLSQALHFGVTTVLDMFSEPNHVAKMLQVAAQRNDVADHKSCCHGATIKGGWPAAIETLFDKSAEKADKISKWPDLNGSTSPAQYVATQKAHGASYIKLFQESGKLVNLSFDRPLPTPSPSTQRAIVDAAHEEGMLAVAHAFSFEDTLAVLNSGVDGLMHGCPDLAPNNDLVDAFQKHNAFVVPTLVILATLSGEEQASREQFGQRLEPTKKENMCACLSILTSSTSIENTYQQIRHLRAAGVDIVAGTDSASVLKGVEFGISLHHEMWLYVKRCGLSAVEALRSATSVTAKRFRLFDRGRIEPGLKADLLLVRGDPTTNIESTLDIVDVWRNGTRLDREH
ncbi:hypothetical protein MMC07_002851 [Pseudocyphellaria aurata]|nr:hypothetical protein [Pseudocyphellaria aurata]